MIETIATIFLLTIGIVGFAAGMAATEHIATINQDQAQLEVAMRQLSDWVRDSKALQYHYCEPASGSDYNVALHQALTPSAGTQFAITKVLESPLKVNGQPNGGAAGPETSGCASGVGDWGVQEITVRVSDAQHSVTRVVWKSASW